MQTEDFSGGTQQGSDNSASNQQMGGGDQSQISKSNINFKMVGVNPVFAGALHVFGSDSVGE